MGSALFKVVTQESCHHHSEVTTQLKRSELLLSSFVFQMGLMLQNKDTNTIYGLGCYCIVLANEVDDTET